ncbi:glutamine amidotransferase-related protein [Acuticoccus mangrovi]|uniref:CTP synthase (glutamine hydrolyzing) n=1 Tax=Acuticoccus mangrovi TaxID=2796142 RepID=A0A934MHX4_9HYPH|nr:gamma-glutamyl-gamma-aminobutyrate hydrolase family protein [Acuticoccus mangrovi]MBJ3776561.1 gamma-glutamyl-gamma-aminobutyrate hydrolase family protein [Acuticoccus mangrovi]
MPADHCRAAAALLGGLRAGGVRAKSDRIASELDDSLVKGSREFVTADGRPAPNGVHWLERVEGDVWTGGDDQPGADMLVVEVAPGATPPRDALVIEAADIPIATDEHGRSRLAGSVAGVPDAEIDTGDKKTGGRRLSIGVVGEAPHLRYINPIVIATLADAVDRAGAVLDLRIISSAEAAGGLPRGLDGLVLPGGSDMSQVEPQIRVAQEAWERDLPTLGLCLGMQDMALAAMRRGGWAQAVLEEIHGPGEQRGFVRMRTPDGGFRQRRGDALLTPEAGTGLAAILGGETRVRMHHNYNLAPDAREPMEAGGFRVVAVHETGVADAAEDPTRRFHVGLQGHPETGACPRLPRLWDAFIAAALD